MGSRQDLCLRKDDSLNSILKQWNIEIDEQSQLQMSHFQIRNQLCLMDGSETIHSFQLHRQELGN